MKFLRAFGDDLFYWLGAGLITAGAYQLAPALALIVAGVFCLLFSYLLGKMKANL